MHIFFNCTVKVNGGMHTRKIFIKCAREKKEKLQPQKLIVVCFYDIESNNFSNTRNENFSLLFMGKIFDLNEILADYLAMICTECLNFI